MKDKKWRCGITTVIIPHVLHLFPYPYVVSFMIWSEIPPTIWDPLFNWYSRVMGHLVHLKGCKAVIQSTVLIKQLRHISVLSAPMGGLHNNLRGAAIASLKGRKKWSSWHPKWTSKPHSLNIPQESVHQLYYGRYVKKMKSLFLIFFFFMYTWPYMWII